MNRLILVATFLALACTLSAETLDAVLGRMDQASTTFHSMTADLTMVTHTAILDDDTTEHGTVKLEKAKKDTQALIDFTGEKDKRTIGFFNKTVQIYSPKLNLVQVYKLGNKSNLLNQYLLLGFGTSGKELTKGYNVQLSGTEQVNGQSASKLVLVPKDAALREQLNQAEIWIPANSAYPVQQKFSNPSGNYRLVTYTNFQLNPDLGSLKLNAPPNAKVEYPQ